MYDEICLQDNITWKMLRYVFEWIYPKLYILKTKQLTQNRASNEDEQIIHLFILSNIPHLSIICNIFPNKLGSYRKIISILRRTKLYIALKFRSFFFKTHLPSTPYPLFYFILLNKFSKSWHFAVFEHPLP